MHSKATTAGQGRQRGGYGCSNLNPNPSPHPTLTLTLTPPPPPPPPPLTLTLTLTLTLIKEGYGGFIQLTGVEELNANLERELAPLVRPEASHAIKLEGRKAFLDASLAASGDVFAMDRGSPNYHLVMDSFQRRLVHDALALGQVRVG